MNDITWLVYFAVHFHFHSIQIARLRARHLIYQFTYPLIQGQYIAWENFEAISSMAGLNASHPLVWIDCEVRLLTEAVPNES
jgi:hypothetical protein